MLPTRPKRPYNYIDHYSIKSTPPRYTITPLVEDQQFGSIPPIPDDENAPTNMDVDPQPSPNGSQDERQQNEVIINIFNYYLFNFSNLKLFVDHSALSLLLVNHIRHIKKCIRQNFFKQRVLEEKNQGLDETARLSQPILTPAGNANKVRELLQFTWLRRERLSPNHMTTKMLQKLTLAITVRCEEILSTKEQWSD